MNDMPAVDAPTSDPMSAGVRVPADDANPPAPEATADAADSRALVMQLSMHR